MFERIRSCLFFKDIGFASYLLRCSQCNLVFIIVLHHFLYNYLVFLDLIFVMYE